jgi:sugar/nucleoside kinase (ribokinase family)
MIAIVGRPGLAAPRREGVQDGVSGVAAFAAQAAASLGSEVQLVGSVGEDREGDEAIVRLGRAGVGHAAVLRDPAGATPVAGLDRRPTPRLDREDVALGLSYISECRVLVLAEPLPPDVRAAAREAAAYHGALIVAVVASDAPVDDLGPDATLFEAPQEEEARFGELLGRYAAALDAGLPAERAFSDAVLATGWEQSTGE